MSQLEDRVLLLRSRIAGANQALGEAEAQMEAAVAQLAPVLVGDKRVASQGLDRAFHNLKAAHALINDLEDMLAAALATPKA